MAESKRQRYEARLSALKNERNQGWNEEWKDISAVIEPRRSRFHLDDTGKGGRGNRNNVVDNTATLAARNLAAGMMAGITSPARPWFELQVDDQALMDDYEVKLWLDRVGEEMRTAMAQSNLYTSLQGLYYELGCFGTGCFVVVDDADKVFRVVNMTVGSYSLANSYRNVVDTMYRELRMTTRQVVQQFGKENCSQTVLNNYNNGQLEAWVDVIHLIEPNDERKQGKSDNQNMPFRSVYFESGSPGDKLLRESGFAEQAVMAPRWDVIGEDVYGVGPGHLALGDSRALQLQQKRKAQAVEMMVRPPMNAPSSMQQRGASIVPGSINYMDPQDMQAGGMVPAISLMPRIDYLDASIQDDRQRIRRAFFEDLFLMIAESDGRMTATEVVERREEKMLMLGPVMQRVHYELLDPLIDRVFGIMMRNGHFPDPPEALQGKEIAVEYISILAQAQKAIGVGSIERFLGLAGNLAGVDQSVLDNIDFDQAITEYAEQTGVPPTLIRSRDVVESIRQRRQEQMEQQQAMENMQQGVNAAKLLSETDVRGDNALSAMGL